MKEENVKEEKIKISKNRDFKDNTKVKEKPKTAQELIKNLENQIKEEKVKYLTALADLENDRKRFEKSKNEFIKFANGKVLEELITIIDTFDMAINIKNPAQEVKNFLKGFEMIVKQFKNLLKNNGVKKIELAPGDKFDFNLHFSIEEVESNKFKPGQIVEIIKDGYKLHERLLRPAMVKVVKTNKKNK